MWTTPERLLPKEDKPVAAWDSHGLYVAKWTNAEDAPKGELYVLWWECSEYGDIMQSDHGPMMRNPDLWAHLPKSDKHD